MKLVKAIIQNKIYIAIVISKSTKERLNKILLY